MHLGSTASVLSHFLGNTIEISLRSSIFTDENPETPLPPLSLHYKFSPGFDSIPNYNGEIELHMKKCHFPSIIPIYQNIYNYYVMLYRKIA